MWKLTLSRQPLNSFSLFLPLLHIPNAVVYKQISVHLPSPTEYPDDSTAGYNMPNLQQVFELSERPSLSAFAGMTIMISLYQRWQQHTNNAAEVPSYPFWESHYRIDKAIGHCQTSLLAHHLDGSSNNSNGNNSNSGGVDPAPQDGLSCAPDGGSDPISLILRMSLAAVEISLHEAAFARARRDDLPAGVAAEAVSRCALAAHDIVAAVALGQALPAGTRRHETFRQVDRFLLWPLAAALHVFSRALCDFDEVALDGAPYYLGPLRVLAGALRGLVDPAHVDPRVLREADARVAEAERSTRRGAGDR